MCQTNRRRRLWESVRRKDPNQRLGNCAFGILLAVGSECRDTENVEALRADYIFI
jgi:hypothetical protein